MPCLLLSVSQSDDLIQVVDINSHTEWQTVQIQISWLLKKSTDLDLHCLQRVYLGSAGPGLIPLQTKIAELRNYKNLNIHFLANIKNFLTAEITSYSYYHIYSRYWDTLSAHHTCLHLSCWINEDATPTSNFQPIRLLDPGCWYKFIY